MPQYGMLVYLPAPADPMTLSREHLTALDAYPDRALTLKGKVLGAGYFAKQRGFAFNPSTEARTVKGGAVREGTLTGPDLVASAFYVVAAPSIEVAVKIAEMHPAAQVGAVEVHPIFKPDDLVQNDYDD